MYNGVGVSTPRGTGTSGYVMINSASLKSKIKQEAPPKKYSKKSDLLIKHEQRRKIELECKNLEIKLKSQNLDPEEIAKIVSERKQKLLNPEILVKLPEGTKSTSETERTTKQKK